MTEPVIPDDIVARAVTARGHAPDHGGIGAAMLAALQAVAHEIAELVGPPRCPHCPHRYTDPAEETT